MLSAYLVAVLGLTTPATPDAAPPVVQTIAAPAHGYEQWGRFAMTQAQKRYPTAAIVDYLHVGRTTYTSTYAKETFKFWLHKPDGHEFGVYVKVYFDPVNNEVQQVLFCETDH